MCSQNGSDCYERIELQEPVDRPGAKLPEFLAYSADYAEPEKHREKENLTYTSNCYNFHKHTFRAVKVFDLLCLINFESLFSNLYFSKVVPAVRLFPGNSELNFWFLRLRIDNADLQVVLAGRCIR